MLRCFLTDLCVCDWLSLFVQYTCTRADKKTSKTIYENRISPLQTFIYPEYKNKNKILKFIWIASSLLFLCSDGEIRAIVEFVCFIIAH